VIGISTDKACKPVNVMGMTKALQERILVEANLEVPGTAFNCVRYGNVIASRGSIVPLFQEQIRKGGPLTVTLPEMTRFLLTLERAVDTVMAALSSDGRGETFVPKVPAARIVDVAKAMMGETELPIVFTGIRPGEKVDEIMVSEEECHRTVERGDYYVILPVLPELRSGGGAVQGLQEEYSSRTVTLSQGELRELLSAAVEEIEEFTRADG
jgi:UDP-glucose 4-epimerase